MAEGGAFFPPYFQGGADQREHRATASFPNQNRDSARNDDGRYHQQQQPLAQTGLMQALIIQDKAQVEASFKGYDMNQIPNGTNEDEDLPIAMVVEDTSSLVDGENSSLQGHQSNKSVISHTPPPYYQTMQNDGSKYLSVIISQVTSRPLISMSISCLSRNTSGRDSIRWHPMTRWSAPLGALGASSPFRGLSQWTIRPG